MKGIFFFICVVMITRTDLNVHYVWVFWEVQLFVNIWDINVVSRLVVWFICDRRVGRYVRRPKFYSWCRNIFFICFLFLCNYYLLFRFSFFQSFFFSFWLFYLFLSFFLFDFFPFFRILYLLLFLALFLSVLFSFWLSFLSLCLSFFPCVILSLCLSCLLCFFLSCSFLPSIVLSLVLTVFLKVFLYSFFGRVHVFICYPSLFVCVSQKSLFVVLLFMRGIASCV